MRKYLAEFIGTFVLTFVACGAASFTGGFTSHLSIAGIALVFGLTLTAMAYALGDISGCHVNPAVSLAMFATGRMELMDLIGYVIAQFLGGIVAALSLFGISKSFSEDALAYQQRYFAVDVTGLGTNGYGEASAVGINQYGALAVEIILTFIFVLTVLSVTAYKKYEKIAGIVIGFSLTAVHLFGIMITGTSVNPARSFGPALIKCLLGKNSTALSQVWVFLVAPLLGGLLAACVFMLLCGKKKSATTESEVNTEFDE